MKTLILYVFLDKVNCSRNYTLLFVAFDLEESGLRGSGYFVQNFTRYLNSSGAGFQGAFILETILNHNTTPNSQELPPGLKQIFPQLYKYVSVDNEFKGDFLAVIGRLVTSDNELMNGITNAFKNDGKLLL